MSREAGEHKQYLVTSTLEGGSFDIVVHTHYKIGKRLLARADCNVYTLYLSIPKIAK